MSARTACSPRRSWFPIDGPIRHGVGLLGSPSFEIPRTVDRDSRLGPVSGRGAAPPARAKNRYNLRTMALALLVRWVHVFGLTLLAHVRGGLLPAWPARTPSPPNSSSATLFTAAYFVLVERAVDRFRTLRPRYCSIYDRYFWWHERYWKLVIAPFAGCSPAPRSRTSSGGCWASGSAAGSSTTAAAMTERTLVAIGDDCHAQRRQP